MLKSFALIVFCFVVNAHCWGPISHLYFVCQSQDIQEVDTCMNSLSSQYLFWGGLLPDGLTIDPFLEDNNCTWSPHTHDPVFAGYMLIQALNSGDVELVQFASGFGAHIISDFVGFYTDPSNPSIHGYMTKKYPVDWTLQWIFMAAVDSFLYHNLSLQTPPMTNISSKIANFFSEATYSYHSSNPQYPALTAETITTCGQNWLDLVQTMTARSAFLTSSNYYQDLVFFDKYGATTPEEAIGNFEVSNYCAYKFVANWISLVEITQDPVQSFNTIKSQMNQEFQNGSCMP